MKKGPIDSKLGVPALSCMPTYAKRTSLLSNVRTSLQQVWHAVCIESAVHADVANPDANNQINFSVEESCKTAKAYLSECRLEHVFNIHKICSRLLKAISLSFFCVGKSL